MFQMLGYHGDVLTLLEYPPTQFYCENQDFCFLGDCSQCNHDNQHVVILCDIIYIYISFCNPIIM